MSNTHLSADGRIKYEKRNGAWVAVNDVPAYEAALARIAELEALVAAVRNELMVVLEVAIARGEKLGYADDDYREAWEGLAGRDWEDEPGATWNAVPSPERDMQMTVEALNY